jgi:glyoxylase-like metal-dependent hydrolase (beta-lactamase superfamily II)
MNPDRYVRTAALSMTHPGLLLVFALFTAMLSPALAQRQYQGIPVVKEGTTVKLSPHVYVIPDENVRGVPNVGIVVGTRATLVIDPGMGARSGQAVLREVAKVSKNTELYIVNTHFHPEHTTGEAAFPASTKIIRAAAQQQDIDEMGMKWVREFASRTPELAELLNSFTGFRPPAETFEREKTLDLGGVRVKLMRLGPGHTRGDTVIFVEGDGVLFSGDLAMSNVFPALNSPQSRVDTWIASLDALRALRPKHVVGAHYAIGDSSMIAAYHAFFTALQARSAELRREGKSADEIAATLHKEFRAKYPAWGEPLRVPAAATAAVAELP